MDALIQTGDAKQRFIDSIRESFNGGVTRWGRVLKWDTVIEQKANELGRFATEKSSMLDFVEPTPKLGGDSSRELRTKILALSQSQAKEVGIGKSTLCYLRHNARTHQLFKTYRKTYEKLSALHDT
jgi:hypothetical protein